jgi:hypothetical protein
MTIYTLLLGNMIPPAQAGLPPDGGGPIGPEQYTPQPLKVSFDNLLDEFGVGPASSSSQARRDLASSVGSGDGPSGGAGQNLPAAGTNSPKTLDDVIPPAVRLMVGVGLAAAQGNPATAFVSILTAFAIKIAELGPDRTGPPARPGFQVCGSEAGYDPVSPTPGEGSAPSGVMTMADWQARQYLEKGAA